MSDHDVIDRAARVIADFNACGHCEGTCGACRGEAEALDAAGLLATPECVEEQAEVDRLRAGIKALHRPVEIEPSETICGHCSWQLPNGRFFGKVTEWPCPTVALLNPTEGGRND